MATQEKKPTYKVIKCRFRGRGVKIFGLIVLVWNNDTHSLEEVHVAVSRFTNVYDVSLDEPFLSITEKIATFTFRGSVVKAMSEGVSTAFKSDGHKSSVRDIFRFCKSKNQERVADIIRSIINRQINDREPHIDFKVEEHTDQEMLALQQGRSADPVQNNASEKTEKLKSVSFELQPTDVLLDAELVLSPMQGKAINDVRSGDKIFIKLIENSERAKYFIDTLNAREKDSSAVVPITASVEQVRGIEGGDFALLIELGPGIFAKCVEENNIKVKIPSEPSAGESGGQDNSLEDDGLDTIERPGKKQGSDSGIMPLVLAVVIVIVVVALFLIVLVMLGVM